MKKCPYCAEEIQPEAIKCRFCNSWLGQPGQATAADPATAEASPASQPSPLQSAAKPVLRGPADPERPKTHFQGVPSWKAFLRAYALTCFFGVLVPVAAAWIARRAEASTMAVVLAALIPAAIGVIAFFAVTFYRKSIRYRITGANVEMEYGILSKRIDNLELWRCRDIRYDQSLLDRMLGIASIRIFTADVTTPEVVLVGMPASRQLFEELRDSIEIQRQARNVIGMVQ